MPPANISRLELGMASGRVDVALGACEQAIICPFSTAKKDHDCPPRTLLMLCSHLVCHENYYTK